jgi:Xaa-Pro dipeptidase
VRLFTYERASALMEEAGVDLILANSMTNVGYLLDYYPHGVYSPSWLLDDGSMFYQSFVGLPADERLGPFFTPWVGEAGNLSETEPWVQDRRFYGRALQVSGAGVRSAAQVEHPVDCVVMAVEDRKLASARIGVEMALLPADSYNRLRAALPLATFADAGPVLSRLRAVKCAEEIRRMRIAAQATERAVRSAYDSVREGSTELEFERALKVTLATEGAGWAWSHVAFGPKGASDIVPRDTAARPGEPLRVDVGGTYGGYVCDMSRVGVLGDPQPELLGAMNATLLTYQAVRGAVRAGARVGDLHRIGSQMMEGAGFQLFTLMVGHGVGRDVHEWPLLVADSDDTLEAGMTLSVEIPLRLQGVGSINVEDVVLVTEDGNESITTLDRELYSIR